MKQLFNLFFIISSLTLIGQSIPIDTTFVNDKFAQVFYKHDNHHSGQVVWIDYNIKNNEWIRIKDTSSLYRSPNRKHQGYYQSRAYFNNNAFELLMTLKDEDLDSDNEPYISKLDFFFIFDRIYWLRFGFHEIDRTLSLISISEPDSTFGTRKKDAKNYLWMPIKNKTLITDGMEVNANALTFDFYWNESTMEKKVSIYNSDDKTTLSVYISSKTYDVVKVEKKFHDKKILKLYEFETIPCPTVYGEYKFDYPTNNSFTKIKDGFWRTYSDCFEYKEQIFKNGKLLK